MNNTKAVAKLLKSLQNNKGEVSEDKKYDPKKQSEGIKTRLEGSGIDVEKATDGRNLFEKAFNLPDEQNLLFDFFEIINRPQQALFGGIKSAQEGESFLQGAKEGVTGRKDTQFKEILNEAGVTEETEGYLGFDDVLGFVGDVVLDPMDIATFGVSKAAKAAKLAKVDDAARAVTAATEGLEVARNMKYVDDAARDIGVKASEAILKNAEAGLEAAKGLKLKQRTATNLLFELTAKTGKKTFSLADSGMTKMLKYWDDTTGALAKEMGTQISTSALTKVQHYENIKKMMSRTFNFLETIPKALYDNVSKIKGRKQFAKNSALVAIHNDMKLIDEAIDEVMKEFSTVYGTVLTKVEAEDLLGTIYQRGDIFDKSGKLTKGLNRKTSVFGMIEEDSFMFHQGIPLKEKELVEEYVKKYFPDWHKKYITKERPMWHVTAESAELGETFRFSVGDEALEELRKGISGITPDQVMRSASKKVNPDDLQAYRTTMSDIKAYEKAKLAGSKRAIRRGTSEEATVKQATRELKEKTKKLGEFNKQMEELVASTGKKTGIRKLRKNIIETQDAITKLEADISVFTDMYSVDIDDLITQTTKHKDSIASLYDGEIEDVFGEAAKAAGEQEIVMGSYFSAAQTAKLEKMAALKSAQLVTAQMHEVMTKATKVINDITEGGIVLTDGYLSHALTPEWARSNINRLKRSTAAERQSWATTKNLLGDSQALGTRRYKVSTLEANRMSKDYAQYLIDTKGYSDAVVEGLKDKKNIDMFARDLRSHFVDFVNKSPDAVSDSWMLHTVVGSAFKLDPNSPTGFAGESKYLVKLNNGDKIPRGFTEVTGDSLKKKLEQMRRYMPNHPSQKGYGEAKELLASIEEIMKVAVGNRFAIDNNVNRLIGRVFDPHVTNSFMKFMDSMTNMFKKNKLLSPGFQLRNIVGNWSNMWLSGIDAKDIGTYNVKAHRTLKKGEELYQKVLEGTAGNLSPADIEIISNYKEFVSFGFGEMGSAIQDIADDNLNINKSVTFRNARKEKLKKLNKELANAKSKGKTDLIPGLEKRIREVKLERPVSKPKEMYDSVVGYNMRKNQSQDGMFRMSLYLYAKEHPEYLTQNGYTSAQDAVRKVLFDYLDLSEVEQDVMRKVVPFYTFTKKNLAYQLTNLPKNAERYNKIIKSFNSMWDMLDMEEDEQDVFKIENFWIPVPFLGEDGSYKAIKSSLPLGDLGEWLSNPLQRAVSSASPIVRAPFELASNTQMFSGMPIQEFKGQKGFQIPELGRKGEYALSQLGLDVPTMAVADIGRTVAQVAKGEQTSVFGALQSSVGRSVLSDGNTQKTAERNAYNELDDLQNLLRYYKQEGVEVLKLSEINNKQKFNTYKSTIARLQQIKKGA